MMPMRPLAGHWVYWVVIGLKTLAIVTILRPIFVRHISKAVTVFMQAAPGVLSQPQHRPAYTYFSGFHVLSFSDVQWSLIEGIAVYAVALTIQVAAARLLTSGRTVQNRAAF